MTTGICGLGREEVACEPGRNIEARLQTMLDRPGNVAKIVEGHVHKDKGDLPAFYLIARRSTYVAEPHHTSADVGTGKVANDLTRFLIYRLYPLHGGRAGR
jgi:hypothetical protein